MNPFMKFQSSVSRIPINLRLFGLNFQDLVFYNSFYFSLVVTCRTAPKIELREEFIDPASHRFILRLDGSETSV